MHAIADVVAISDKLERRALSTGTTRCYIADPILGTGPCKSKCLRALDTVPSVARQKTLEPSAAAASRATREPAASGENSYASRTPSSGADFILNFMTCLLEFSYQSNICYIYIYIYKHIVVIGKPDYFHNPPANLLHRNVIYVRCLHARLVLSVEVDFLLGFSEKFRKVIYFDSFRLLYI